MFGLGRVVHTSNLRTQEVGAGGLPRVQCLSGYSKASSGMSDISISPSAVSWPRHDHSGNSLLVN